MHKYKHFISLGYFCSTALELERMGLRDCSSPFDWIISDWHGVEKAIKTNFKDFLLYDNLYQDKNDYSHYKDGIYGFKFFHDFSKYESLSNQLLYIQQKYRRRIERFYKNIKEPTLFVRYISSENGDLELKYIEQNYKNIEKMLKKHNKNNNICFIANSDVHSDILKIFYVDKDKNDIVARKPCDKNKELFYYLDSFDLKEKERNLLRYKKRNSFVLKLYKKMLIVIDKIKSRVKKPYKHFQQF